MASAAPLVQKSRVKRVATEALNTGRLEGGEVW